MAVMVAMILMILVLLNNVVYVVVVLMMMVEMMITHVKMKQHVTLALKLTVLMQMQDITVMAL